MKFINKKVNKAFIDYIKQIEGYTLLNQYKTDTDKVFIRHEDCGREYLVQPYKFKKLGQRCIQCSKKGMKEQYGKEYFYLFKENGYTPLEEYQGNHTKILIRHEMCGHEYRVSPSKFKYSGRRCPKCRGGVKKSHEEFMDKVVLIHGDDYSILSDYINANSPVEILHKECGKVFYASPNNFTKKNKPTGCPYCYASHGEKQVRKVLMELGVIFEEQKTFANLKNINLLKFDFYLPEYNAVIEYNGKQHYYEVPHFGGYDGFVSRRINDDLKKHFCIENNIAFIEIPFLYSNISEQIINQLGITNSLNT